MSQQELDLLKFAACRAAQLGAGAAQVVGRKAGNADLGRVVSEHLPDDLFAQVLAGNAASSAHRPEDVANRDAGGRSRPGNPVRSLTTRC